MYIHDLNPVFIDIGFLQIRWYGILYAIGFLFLYYYLSYIAKKKQLIHFHKDDVEPFLIGMIISVIIGARIFHTMVYYPGYYFTNPLDILKIWEGGLSFHGALVFSTLWIYYFCKKKHIPFFHLTDIIVLPAALFLALGRMANFVNAELVGKVTNVSWGVDFSQSNPDFQGFRHPTQIYESIKNLFLFGVLIVLNILRNKFFQKYAPGLLTVIFLVIYGTLRFFIEFLKEGASVIIGLNMGQILSLGMVFLAGFVLFNIWDVRKRIHKYHSKDKFSKK